MRILVITGRPLADAAGNPVVLLDVAEERRRIGEALRQVKAPVQVHFLPEALTGDIQTALDRPWDVIHITGHGTPDGELVLENRFGQAHVLPPARVVTLLGKAAPLVVISACYSELIARALCAAGVPTLVAIDARRPIADRAATLFAARFYGLLAQGRMAADAFAQARNAVALDEQVGDDHPPLDEHGQPEEPWSARFRLIGDGAAALRATAGEPGYRESGATGQVVGNLRPRSATFTGRAREIVEIVQALDGKKAQRVALHGPGGIGKTELARAVAWWYAERGRGDAVLWASASPVVSEYRLRDLATLLSIAGRALGLPLSEQMKLDEQKQVVRSFCAGHGLLLILDNWEAIATSSRLELWDFVLSLPDTVRLLVTSREGLPPKDAYNLELKTLTPADAARLFLRIMDNAGYFRENPVLGKEELSILNAICERLSGYPLAIEVVASLTAARTLGEIWEALKEHPKDVLESTDPLTGEPRGVWTSLDLSYDTLPAAEQALFRQMAVFLHHAAVEDVAAVTQIESPRLLLDTLIQRALVQIGEGVYSLLPIVRDYAAGKLKDAGQDVVELHVRAVRYYEQKGTLESALAASDHLYALADDYHRRQAGEAFIKYLPGFYYDLVTQGYWAEARRKTEELIAVARALEDKKTEAQALHEMGLRYSEIGELDVAAVLYQQSLDIKQEMGDKRGIAGILHEQAMLAQDQGDYAAARQLYQQSLNTFKALGARHEQAAVLHQQAILAQDQGDYAAARQLYQQSLDTLRELGTIHEQAAVLHGQANVAYLQGDYPAAGQLYQQSLDKFKELGDKHGIASTLHQQAMLAQDRSDYAAARQLYQQSLAIEQELGNKRGIAGTLHQQATLAQDRSDYAAAHRLYKQSLDVKQAIGDKRGIAVTLHGQGTLAQAQGDYDAARQLYQQSLEIEQELGDKRGIAGTLHEQAMLAQDQGDYAAARQLYRQSLNTFEALGARHEQAAVLHQQAMLAQDQGDYASARRLYQQSLDIAEELGDKHGIAQTLHQQAILAKDQGDYATARQLNQQSLDIKQELGDKQGIAQTLHQQANVAYLQGDYAAARQLYQQSLDIKQEVGDKRGIAGILHQQAMLAQDQGDYIAACQLYQQSLSIEQELGDKRGIASTLHQQAMLAQDQGDYDSARRLYQQSLDIKQELGDKRGIASILGQMGRLAQQERRLKEALGLYLVADSAFEELHSPDREITGGWIGEIREAVGEEQFAAWMKEIDEEGKAQP